MVGGKAVNRFDFHQPSTLAKAIELLENNGEKACIIAGGTALLIDMQHGEKAPSHLIGLERVPGLKTIHENGGLHIGALVTLTDLAGFAGKRPDLYTLTESIWLFGGKQI